MNTHKRHATAAAFAILFAASALPLLSGCSAADDYLEERKAAREEAGEGPPK